MFFLFYFMSSTYDSKEVCSTSHTTIERPTSGSGEDKEEISLYCAHICIHIHVIKQMITPKYLC